MGVRELRLRIFLGSTLEEIERDVNDWCKDAGMCPGNLVKSDLHKHGSVYQLLVWYAEVVAERRRE